MLVNQGQALVDYFVELAGAVGDGKMATNWVQQDVLRTLKEQSLTIDKFRCVRPPWPNCSKRSERASSTPAGLGRSLSKCCPAGRSAAELMQSRGIAKVDESDLVALGQELLAANPKVVADIKAGKLQAASNLIGQAKKKNPNVNPGRFREIVIELAGQM